MSSFIPPNHPAFRPRSTSDRAAEGPAAIEARQVITVAVLALLSWTLLLAPFFVRV